LADFARLKWAFIVLFLILLYRDKRSSLNLFSSNRYLSALKDPKYISGGSCWFKTCDSENTICPLAFDNSSRLSLIKDYPDFIFMAIPSFYRSAKFSRNKQILRIKKQNIMSACSASHSSSRVKLSPESISVVSTIVNFLKTEALTQQHWNWLRNTVPNSWLEPNGRLLGITWSFSSYVTTINLSVVGPGPIVIPDNVFQEVFLTEICFSGWC